MSGFKKLYVVGEKKERKKQSPIKAKRAPSPPPKKESPRRAGIRYNWVFFFVLTSFVAGLFLGLKEDYEGEETYSTVMASLGNNSYESQGFRTNSKAQRPSFFENHVFSNFDLSPSNHFYDRISCRNISMKEVRQVLGHGWISKVFPFNKDRATNLVNPKLNVTGMGEFGRKICVSLVFPDPEKPKNIVLVTAFEVGIKDDGCN